MIGEVGLAGRDPVCAEALDVFVTVYGAQAGNLALATLALGGVVVAGGIAPKLAPKLTDGRFIEAFRAKAASTLCLPPYLFGSRSIRALRSGALRTWPRRCPRREHGDRLA